MVKYIWHIPVGNKVVSRMCFSVNMNVAFRSRMDAACDSRQLPSFEIATGVPSAEVQAQGARRRAKEECLLPT